jgi:hypothetical protein
MLQAKKLSTIIYIVGDILFLTVLYVVGEKLSTALYVVHELLALSKTFAKNKKGFGGASTD